MCFYKSFLKKLFNFSLLIKKFEKTYQKNFCDNNVNFTTNQNSSRKFDFYKRFLGKSFLLLYKVFSLSPNLYKLFLQLKINSRTFNINWKTSQKVFSIFIRVSDQTFDYKKTSIEFLIIFIFY